jgi:hypothetical protein
MILSGTRPANHHRLPAADDCADQPRNRVFERHSITERSVYGIVTDLTAAGCVVKEKDGRRNRYQIQAHMPLPEPASQHLAIGEVLALLAGASTGGQLTGGNPAEATTASRTGLRL